MKAYRSAVTIVICITACHVFPMAAQIPALYAYGSGVDTETVSLADNGAECMDFSKVRIMNSITNGTASLGDLLTSSGKLCISFNGGLAFSETAIPTGTYGPVVTGSMSQEAAILPLYFNYGTNINFNDDPGTSGIFYTVSTDATTLQTYVNDISSCGLAVNDFKAFWAVKVTWANLLDAGNSDLFGPSLSNTFQVVLLGNAGDALFVIINYGKMDANPTTTLQTLIQGDGANVFPWTADTTGGNCDPVSTPGRFVYYISDDTVRQPSDSHVCDGTVNCGHYYGLVSTDSGPLSGNCAGSVCTCEPAHSGIYCLNDMTNECASSPCNATHSLFCEDTGLGSEVPDPASRYRCYCDFGYTGATCDKEIQACDSNPCTNGGTCGNIEFDFQCTCPPEWTGTTCHLDVDECATLSPCQNGGTCTNNAGGYTCDCPDGVSGDNCECGGWEPWSTKCQAPAGWDGTCGGCGEQYRTRTCGVGSTDDLMETRSCNMRCCDRSLYSEKTERRYATSDTGMPITKIRPRFCCYKFPSLQPVTKAGGKRCEYVTGGFC